MKSIKLKRLILDNFKGIKSIEINFTDETTIQGDNGTGKTTIFDAFTWLLFDKDSKYRKDFQIKTLDNNGEPLHNLSHIVTGLLEIDGQEINLSKVYTEKWTKKKGETDKILTGHETQYYIDGVPVKKNEYTSFISKHIDEDIFLLLTNPLYFSTILGWKERRDLLFKIIGNVSDETIINSNRALQDLGLQLNGRTVEEFKTLVLSKKKSFNEEMKTTPGRVDELRKTKVDCDFENLEKVLEEKQNLLTTLKLGVKSNKQEEEKRKQIKDLKNELWKVQEENSRKALEKKQNLTSKLYETKDLINITSMEVNKIKQEISKAEVEIKNLDDSIFSLRNEWHDINIKVMPSLSDTEFKCPTCHRAYEGEDMETMKREYEENFNLEKASKLMEINKLGKVKADRKNALVKTIEIHNENLEKQLGTLNELTFKMENIELTIRNFKTNTEESTLKDITDKIEALEREIEVSQENETSKEDIEVLIKEIETLNRNLSAKELNKNLDERITKLMDRERELGVHIAGLEKLESLCNLFTKTKVEFFENEINSKFKYVTFKLFKENINGALVEDCEVLLNGVPFSNVNTAGQINAGLDVINTLGELYGVSAPIFIDGAESVTNFIEVKPQVIKLEVNNYECLKVINN